MIDMMSHSGRGGVARTPVLVPDAAGSTSASEMASPARPDGKSAAVSALGRSDQGADDHAQALNSLDLFVEAHCAENSFAGSGGKA